MSGEKPRNQCADYVSRNGGRARLVSVDQFEKWQTMGKFVDGPYKDSFGDGRLEPYNPDRQAFGKLEGGTIIFCELNQRKSDTETKSEEVK